MAAYVTYTTAAVAGLDATRRVVERVHRTQAAADARATATAGVSAYQGAVSDDVDVGWWLAVSGDGAGIVSAVAPALAADTARRRAAARQLHAALQGWTVALRAEGVVHEASVVAVGHDFLFRAHQALWIMAHRNLLPIAEFEDWCAQMGSGAADVTSPQVFFVVMEGAGTPIAAPTGPCAWVRWGHTQQEGLTTAVRVNLADAVAASGPVTVQAPGNLALVASDLPQGGLAADGSWIDSLS